MEGGDREIADTPPRHDFNKIARITSGPLWPPFADG
jgi:hypothetical protein